MTSSPAPTSATNSNRPSLFPPFSSTTLLHRTVHFSSEPSPTLGSSPCPSSARPSGRRRLTYLQATVKNTGDYRLLPESVYAFVDDSFVSKTAIVGDVAPLPQATSSAAPSVLILRRASVTRARRSAQMTAVPGASATRSLSSGRQRPTAAARPSRTVTRSRYMLSYCAMAYPCLRARRASMGAPSGGSHHDLRFEGQHHDGDLMRHA